MNAHGPTPCASCWHIAAQATLDAYHEPQPNDPAFYVQPGAVVPAPRPYPSPIFGGQTIDELPCPCLTGCKSPWCDK